MDELYDDPIRKYIKDGRRGGGQDDDAFDFTKSKKGLGELYEDDYRKKLLKNDPNAFLLSGNDLTGADSALKQEINVLMRNLFYQLDNLTNLHFTPRPPTTDAPISTQNVPALLIEDALPLAVNTAGQTKSAREVFSISAQKLRGQRSQELSKEERRAERATRKRKIKAHLKQKENGKKEKKREAGIAMKGDRFEMRQMVKKQQNNAASDKKSKGAESGAEKGSKNEMKSSKFFSKMQEVAKDDAARKDQKRKAKQEGKDSGYVNHNNGTTKRFKL